MKIFYMLIILFPLFAQSQDMGKWTMYIDKKIIAEKTIGEAQTITLKKSEDSNIKFRFSAIDTAVVRSIIVMNEKRVGLDNKQVPQKCSSVVFSIKNLFAEANGQSILFYIVDKPADATKAALVRVAPLLFCTVLWKE